MGRRRKRLVPQGAVECFEVRIVLYFDEDGEQFVSYGISDPTNEEAEPPVQEVLGTVYRGLNMIDRAYDKESDQ